MFRVHIHFGKTLSRYTSLFFLTNLYLINDAHVLFSDKSIYG